MVNNKTVFIDTSFYLSLLNTIDNNHNKALLAGKKHQACQHITSQAILGEILTVGSQRYDRELSIKFVEELIKSETRIVLENIDLVKKSFKIFKKIKSKNVSWVDCYSFAIMSSLGIKKALTFDKDFQRYLSRK